VFDGSLKQDIVLEHIQQYQVGWFILAVLTTISMHWI
jgi:hypothetical protein